MSIPTLTVTPSSAANAYARVQSGTMGGVEGSGFGDVLNRALEGVVNSGHEADAQAMRAISGQGNLTEVATAVSRAELSLQTAISIRDKVVQAYQDVIRMPI